MKRKPRHVNWSGGDVVAFVTFDDGSSTDPVTYAQITRQDAKNMCKQPGAEPGFWRIKEIRK